MNTKFLFMDEKYADQGAARISQTTSLTGVLIPAATHKVFRRKFYSLVAAVVGDPENVISHVPMIHAMELFPNSDDAARFSFLEDLVALAIELDFRIYRVGYRTKPDLVTMFGGEAGIVGLCFSGMLYCLEAELAEFMIWPVMEIDHSPKQDQSFAGHMQNLDYMTSRLKPGAMSIDNENLGEVLYTTKRSAHGSVVDCFAYLLHQRFLKSIGQPQTPFKARLAEIAEPLLPIIAFDEVIEVKRELPPAGYRSSGPIRYIFPITPRD